MNTKTIIFPNRYVQGPNALAQIGDHLQSLGIKNPLVMGGQKSLDACEEKIKESLDATGMTFKTTTFNGETTWVEIERIKTVCLNGNHDAIISCGGGKALDAGRTAAAGNAINAGIVPAENLEGVGANIQCVQVPTIAATDAPTAKLSVIYNEQNEFETFLIFPTNPSMVFVDTEVIANAPVEQLVYGMGDALATFFEADMTHSTATATIAGGLCSRTALMMARMAFDTLMEFGVQAKLETQNKIAGPALEAVVEANILLSGLGYENGGLSAAHAIALSYTRIINLFEQHPSHGELVAFSTLTQLMMSDRHRGMLDQVYKFCKSVGLPTTFDELGIKNISDEQLRYVADDASKNVLIMSMPKASSTPDENGRFYDPEEIFTCLKLANAYGSK